MTKIASKPASQGAERLLTDPAEIEASDKVLQDELANLAQIQVRVDASKSTYTAVRPSLSGVPRDVPPEARPSGVQQFELDQLAASQARIDARRLVLANLPEGYDPLRPPGSLAAQLKVDFNFTEDELAELRDLATLDAASLKCNARYSNESAEVGRADARRAEMLTEKERSAIRRRLVEVNSVVDEQRRIARDHTALKEFARKQLKPHYDAVIASQNESLERLSRGESIDLIATTLAASPIGFLALELGLEALIDRLVAPANPHGEHRDARSPELDVEYRLSVHTAEIQTLEKRLEELALPPEDDLDEDGLEAYAAMGNRRQAKPHQHAKPLASKTLLEAQAPPAPKTAREAPKARNGAALPRVGAQYRCGPSTSAASTVTDIPRRSTKR